MINKTDLPTEIITARTIVRRATPEDLPSIAAWPPYPWPYDCFNMTNEHARSPRGPYWWEEIDQADRCHYSIVFPDQGQIIGVHAFVRIDWSKKTVGNMGIRIRPDLCDQGYGTETLGPLFVAVLGSGIQSIRLDVAATNKQAIRCYEKSGMQIVDEFWHEGVGPADPTESKWAPLMPHLRREADKWMVRFYWMAIHKVKS